MATTPERERLIRDAWNERGSKEWEPATHGRGLKSLNIQASTDMRTAPFAYPMPPYDNLEFRLVHATIDGQPMDSVVCEDVVVLTLPMS
jgi:hypothetical protein